MFNPLPWDRGHPETNLKPRVFASLLELPLHLYSNKVEDVLVLYSFKSYFFMLLFLVIYCNFQLISTA